MALNLQNEEWFIKNGVLKRYSGTDKDIVIPDGVTVIESKVFYRKNIETVVIPDSVKRIGSCAFECNNLESIKIPVNVSKIGRRAFNRNWELWTVSIYDTTILSKDEPIEIYDDFEDTTSRFKHTGLTTLIIHHHAKRIIPFLRQFRDNSIKQIVIKDNPISEKEREKIHRMFKDASLECDILENQKQEVLITAESEAKDKLDMDEPKIEKGLTKDEEINGVIDKIKAIIAPMDNQVERKISEELERLIEQYLKDIDTLEPQLNFNYDPILDPKPNFSNLKIDLLNKLNSILFSLTNQEKLVNLLTEIEDYRQLKGKTIDIPSQIETRSDKILFSIAVSSIFQNSQIMQQLDYTFDYVSKRASKLLQESVVDREEVKLSTVSEISIFTIFDKEINRIYDIVGKYYVVQSALNGIGRNELSKDIKMILKIIDTLEEEDKIQFLSKLASIREEFNLDQFVDNDLESIILAVRKKLHPILESLNQIMPKPIIERVVQEIAVMLENPIIPEPVKMQAKAELVRVIRNWKNKIINNELQLDRNPALQPLDDDTKLQLQILSDLYGIESEIMTYLADRQEYDKLKGNV